MGHTLTLDVPEEVYQALRQQAEHTGQPPETVAVQLLTSLTHPQHPDPLGPFIGAFSSQGTDWADHHNTYLGQSLRATMSPDASEGHSHA